MQRLSNLQKEGKGEREKGREREKEEKVKETAMSKRVGGEVFYYHFLNLQAVTTLNSLKGFYRLIVLCWESQNYVTV